ncbi:lactosylceramide 1,3-N-acetyl-beta-D-glucosaminyltransferase [Spea bombifrons]|uniref:lactosylceramide 1,3-N-acetyl-beta-D-glucosaminyltransferase n=1 Tax=Spea bombifrons TaxID=233779 RepID=UPI00234A3C44|nr:lactosylceramide 1,3-N-acetyl-beta-D-glucosaminyltransferase [Spea bombifrons]
MLISARRLKRCQFLQILTTCFVLSLMLMWVQDDNDFVNHIKSYSYRYLINSYDFINESLSITHGNSDGTRNYKYLMTNQDKCQNEDVLLLLFVKTSPENRKRRDAIRRTWGNELYIRSQHAANIKVVFALGIDSDPVKSRIVQRELVAENTRYNDLIQQDFLDTFHNLTLKLLLQFGWVNSYCSNAKFVMSADDDIFIHTPNLVSYLKMLDLIGVQDFWIGRVHRGSPPIRHKKSKYYVSYEMYPWASYPDYTAGAAYVVSRDVAAKVYEASQTLSTNLYIDDVFMGICANKVGVVPQYHVFFSGEGKAPYHPCIYSKMITSHGHLDDIDYLWRQATDPKVYSLTSGFLGDMYCKFVKIMLLCRIHYVETYPCSAAWS